MSEPTPKPTVAAVPDPKKLDEAAVKINTEYEAILTQDKNMKAEGDRIVVRAIAVGDMLLTVKEAVGHGNWLPWLTTKCPNIPERTAQRWMLLAKKKEVLAERMKSATMADLTLKQALDLCEDVEFYPDDEEEQEGDGEQGCGDLVNVDDSEKPKKSKKPRKKKSKADKPEKEKIEYQKVVDPITANKAYQLFESHLIEALEELIERSNLDYAKECAEATIKKLQGKVAEPEEEEEQAAA